MHGITRPGRRPGQTYAYYLCPHDPKDPRHAQAYPDHERTSVSDEIIAAAIARFADQHLLGHDRAAMLETQLPAGDAELAEQRDRQAAALRKQLAKIETAQNGLLAQAERLGDDTRPAAQAMRDRIYAQYTQRHDQHTALSAELDALTTPAPGDPDAADPSLLDELPYAPGLLNEAPAAIRQAIYAAFDIHCLYRQDQGQVTIWATSPAPPPASSRPCSTTPAPAPAPQPRP